MQINVAQLLRQPIGSSRSYKIEHSITENENTYPVNGEVELIRTGQGILVRGNLHTQRTLTCSRCLCTFSYPLTININDEYLPRIDAKQGAPRRIPVDSAGFTIDRFNVLDLTEAVRQYALINTPINPLCNPDCAGLCQECGTDLNTGSCDCNSHTPAINVPI